MSSYLEARWWCSGCCDEFVSDAEGYPVGSTEECIECGFDTTVVRIVDENDKQVTPDA